MANARAVEAEKEALQLYWSRLVLVLGLLWGAWRLTALPVTLLALKPTDPKLATAAIVVNALSVAPACCLAFWFRTPSGMLLLANSVLLWAALLGTHSAGAAFNTSLLLDCCVSLALVLFLLITQLLGWKAPIKGPAAAKGPASAKPQP